ncbi:MAG: hypothetical protein LBJ20_01685 [Candidatus Methanoplasma sp.]|jgi:hypothetical protein|nr:hypothetical protein [Candidatus Methanoplasma sp.]
MILDGELWGYLSLIWVVLNFGYAVLRGHGLNAAIYGIALFAGLVIALNWGGMLNASNWHYFGLAIFAVEFLYNFWRGPRIKMIIFGVLLFASVVLGW